MLESAVFLELPPTWAVEPQNLFAQAEAEFALRSIVADDTKYYYVKWAL